MEDPLSQEKGLCVVVTLMEMTSLESTEQKPLPVVCYCRHAYYYMVILFLTIILFTITQGKQYLQYHYEQYTIWVTYSTTSIYINLLLLFTLFKLQYLHDMQYTTNN